jgi:hypothetical protein
MSIGAKKWLDSTVSGSEKHVLSRSGRRCFDQVRRLTSNVFFLGQVFELESRCSGQQLGQFFEVTHFVWIFFCFSRFSVDWTRSRVSRFTFVFWYIQSGTVTDRSEVQDKGR